MKPTKHLFLIGFMGSGKTTIGKLLAEKLNCPFIDTDEEIEKLEKKSVSTIFEENGEDYFRGKERSFVEGLKDQKPAVVSLGGGFPSQENALELLNQLGLVIYLNTSLLTLIKTLEKRT